jgi:hypothetical protein
MSVYAKAKEAFNTVFSKNPTQVVGGSSSSMMISSGESMGLSFGLPMWTWLILPLVLLVIFRKKLSVLNPFKRKARTGFRRK